jgi:hypothetical protein
MKCVKCSVETCVLHGCLWDEGVEAGEHNKETCATLLQTDNLEARSLAVLKKVSRPCPTCRVPIQKSTGCDMVACESKYLTKLSGI